MSLIKPKDLIDRLGVDGLMKTADHYFHGFDLSEPQVRKPFSTVEDTPRHLKNLGAVLEGLRLGRGMTVLDFGAGTCWLSRYLADIGLSVIALDPSAKALELGRQWFERYPPADTPEPPRFLHFDGRTIDLPDASVDRIIAFDAFHHVPNPEEVIHEFARVLRPGGIAGFNEPGKGHSEAPLSQYEMRKFDVLENDLDMEAIERWALEGGFTHVWMELGILDAAPRFSARDAARLGRGRRKWPAPRRMLDAARILRATLRGHYIFFLSKGEPRRDSRSSIGLAYEMTLLAGPEPAPDGESVRVRLSLRNTGEAVWLHETPNGIGVVNLGVRRCEPERRLPVESLVHLPLPRGLSPGEELEMEAAIPSSPPSGLISLDLVAEQVAWIGDMGSQPVLVELAAP